MDRITVGDTAAAGGITAIHTGGILGVGRELDIGRNGCHIRGCGGRQGIGFGDHRGRIGIVHKWALMMMMHGGDKLMMHGRWRILCRIKGIP